MSRATQGITVYVYGIQSEDTRWLTQKSNLSRLLAWDVHELSTEPVKKLLVRARLKTHTMSELRKPKNWWVQAVHVRVSSGNLKFTSIVYCSLEA